MKLFDNVSEQMRERILVVDTTVLRDWLHDTTLAGGTTSKTMSLLRIACRPIFAGAPRNVFENAIQYLANLEPDESFHAFPSWEAPLFCYLQGRRQSARQLARWAEFSFSWLGGKEEGWQDHPWREPVVSNGIDLVCAAILGRDIGAVPAVAERFLAPYTTAEIDKKKTVRRGRMLPCLLANLILLYRNEETDQAVARIEALLGAFAWILAQDPPRSIPRLFDEKIIVFTMLLQYHKECTGGVEEFLALFEILWQLADRADPELCRQ